MQANPRPWTSAQLCRSRLPLGCSCPRPSHALHKPEQAPPTVQPADRAPDAADFHHPVDPEEFRKLGYQVVDWIVDYYEGLESHSKHVRPDVQPGYLRPLLPDTPPEHPESFDQVMADFEKVLMPGVMHWQHPKFFAWFSANTSFPATLADMLGGALNMIGFTWQSSPVSTELEMVMMDWLAQLLGMPPRFMFSSKGPGGGVIQGTSSEAVLVALLAARTRAMRDRPPSDALRLVAYASDQAHSAFQKACMVANISHVRAIPATESNDFALDPEDLRAAMQADLDVGLLPCFVLATIGTTSTCAVDPVGRVGEVAAQLGAWSHVDAAYAGSAAVLPDQRAAHFQGIDMVDSFSFNPHKWLLTNFDCCALWVADSRPLREALSLTPVFLQGAGNALDLKDWQVPLGRRFRSLKLFFVLRMYGAEGLRRYIAHHLALAQHFAHLVQSDPRLELAAPPRFGLVCFRLCGAPREQQVRLLEQVNARGDMFLTQTEVAGRFTLRLAIGSSSTQMRHVLEAWQVVRAAVDQVVAA